MRCLPPGGARIRLAGRGRGREREGGKERGREGERERGREWEATKLKPWLWERGAGAVCHRERGAFDVIVVRGVRLKSSICQRISIEILWPSHAPGLLAQSYSH